MTKPKRTPSTRSRRKPRKPPPPKPSARASVRARARAPAREETKDEVLEGAINEILELAVENGMSKDEVNAVLFRMVDRLADEYRSNLRLHKKDT